jgi:hypothetical protein
MRWPDGVIDQEMWLLGSRATESSKTTDAGDDNTVRNGLHLLFRLRLVDAVTNEVAGLVYCPFVVLLVLFVAQNRVFDDWHWDWSKVLIGSACLATTLACALYLQRRANQMKLNCLNGLDGLLRPYQGGTASETEGKLKRIRHDVVALNSGAFSGWSNNPVVQAILIASAGGGLIAGLQAVLTYLWR